jgi:hypothetical protein
MIIHRSYPESQFVIIPNATLRDDRLSYLARGVLAEMLSRPDDWSVRSDAIWRHAQAERGKDGEGRDALRRSFTQFELAGYLYRERRRAGRGRFVTELHLFDSPDGLQAWLAARAFMAMLVDNSAPADVSAGRTDDGLTRRRWTRRRSVRRL